MRWLRALGLATIALGIAAVVAGVLAGEIQVGLLLIVPYLQSSSWMGAMAMLLLFAGFLLLFLSAFSRPRESPATMDGGDLGTSQGESNTQKEFGGVVLIGPVPIVFGSSSRSALLALALAAMMVMALMLAMLLIM